MTGEITIRRANAADARHIAAIQCASWRDAYSNILDPAYLAGPIEDDRQALWNARFAAPTADQMVLVAVSQSKDIVGFICSYRNHDAQWGDLIDNLHVQPALRGQRIGERLMQAAASELGSTSQATPLHLWVFAANQAGLRFYQRLGGEIVERKPSDAPAANGAPLLRVYWSDSFRLAAYAGA